MGRFWNLQGEIFFYEEYRHDYEHFCNITLYEYFICYDVQAETERIRIAEEAKETELLSQALELSNQLSRYVNKS